MQITIEELDPADGVQMQDWQVVRSETEAIELNPDDPPAPVAELRHGLETRTTERYVRGWLARVDGEPAGEAIFEFEETEENRHIASSDWVAVRPSHRRRGVADTLLHEVLTTVVDEGISSLLLWAHERQPDVGRAYAERLGLVEATSERCSRLRMTDLDDALVDRWITEGRSRDDGYEIVQFEGHCPDELMPAYLTATAAMDDMPTDELEWQVASVDDALIRSREARWEAAGTRVARTLALAPDGSGAGFSELFVNGYRPSLADQGDTGVVATHRGHGLGRWLKAENLRFAQRLSPTFETVETYNAQSNPWMLDINVAMGFRPHLVWRGFQGDVATALDRLAPS